MVYYPKSREVRLCNRDYERAPKGGHLLNELRLQRGLGMDRLALLAGFSPSETYGWCSRKRSVPKTPRIITALSKTLEVPPDLLWEYLLGNVPLEDIPPSKAQMRAAIPDSWVKALYPIVTVADKKSISNVLRRLSAKVLSKK
jgi:transcriptional regulator with XRE-family HTH domain